METIISNSLKTFRQYVLNHSSEESESREGLMFNLSCFMVTVPVADRIAIIPFNPFYRNRRRDNILRKVFGQSFTSWRHFTGLEESHKAFRIIFPCPVYIFFDGRVGHFFPEHLQKMILPFFMHHLIRNIRDTFPLFLRINSACGHKNMQMRVVMSGSSSGLENNNVSHIKFNAGAGVENVFETGMSSSDERAEQFRITVKPCSQELRHGQHYVSICYAGQKSSGDKISPTVSID